MAVAESKTRILMQAVSLMANLLLDALRNTGTSPAEATDACKHLLQLQAEGSPCMEHCDPIQLYLTTQVRICQQKGLAYKACEHKQATIWEWDGSLPTRGNSMEHCPTPSSGTSPHR